MESTVAGGNRRRRGPLRRRACSPVAEHVAVEWPRGGALHPRATRVASASSRTPVRVRGSTARRRSLPLGEGRRLVLCPARWRCHRRDEGPGRTPFLIHVRVRVRLTDLKSVRFDFFLSPDSKTNVSVLLSISFFPIRIRSVSFISFLTPIWFLI